MNGKLKSLTAEQAYFPSNARESRDERRRLTYVTADDRLKLIRGMPVLNVETQMLEEL
jgi:hypothetical protein